MSGLFITAYMARYLGPSQFGLLNYVTSLVSLFSVVATLGLESLVVRELVKDEGKTNQILGTALVLRLMASGIVFFFLVFFATILQEDTLTRNLIYIVAVGIFFETFTVIEFFFQSKVASKYAAWSQMIALAFSSMIRLMFILINAPLEWFAVSYVIDFLVLALSLVWFYNRKIENAFQRWKFNSAMAMQFLVDAWPLILSSLAVTVYMKIGQIMIKLMLGDEASGNYGIAVRLCEMWNFIPTAIAASLFPAILNAKIISETLYLKRCQQLYELMVVIALGIAIPLTFFSDLVVYILFGAAYTEASKIITIYTWSSVFVFLGVANGKWLLTENLMVFRMKILIVTGFLNIILNYIFIRTVGITGAAFSTLISQAFAGYVSLALTRRTRAVFWQLTNSLNIFQLPKRILNRIKERID